MRSRMTRFRAPKAVTHGVTSHGRSAYRSYQNYEEVFVISGGCELTEQEVRSLQARMCGWLISLRLDRGDAAK